MLRPVTFTLLGVLIFALALIAYRQFAIPSVATTPPLMRATGSTNTRPLQTANGITTTVQLPIFSHIFLIILENKEQSSIIGNPEAHYINQLAAQYARANNFYATRKPSLPNYLALTGGNTFSITTDCTDCFVKSDNLATQIEASGRSWKAYMEAMPRPCYVGDPWFNRLYRQKHNPFIYYDNIRTNPVRCNKIVPFEQFTVDLQKNSLPNFAWITPDTCNDMHNCPISTGDAWVQKWVPLILASPAWKNNGVLFITFDEGDGRSGCCTYAVGGQITTLVISPLVKAGFVSHINYDHYSLLRTIEAAWGLPLLGKANCDCSPPMLDFFVKPAEQE